jgi:hypothetical protein
MAAMLSSAFKKIGCDFLPQFEHACLSSEETQVQKKKRVCEGVTSGVVYPISVVGWMRFSPAIWTCLCSEGTPLSGSLYITFRRSKIEEESLAHFF